MEDVEHETFLSMLEYIYTGEVSCSPVVTIDLLKCKYIFFNAIIILLYIVADMFGMEDLKVICMSRIPEHLSVDTVLVVLDAVSKGDSLSIYVALFTALVLLLLQWQYVSYAMSLLHRIM